MKLPILMALPHGKTTLPPSALQHMTLADEQILEKYCDYGSEELFTGKLWHTISAPYSRLFCDLNRSSEDWSHSPDLKKAGVVRQKTEEGDDIYTQELTETQKEARVSGYDDFYAKCLHSIENEPILFFIAGHTMEDYPMGETPTAENRRPDVVISTNNFQTCDEVTAYHLADAFRQQGFTVKIDDPFLGGHLLTHFCATDKLPGVQIEMRRGLFSYGAHEISAGKLQDAKSRIQRAILVFWEKFLTERKR